MPTQKKSIKKKNSNTAGKKTAVTVPVWEMDPGSGSQPDGGRLVFLPVPKMNATSLPTIIQNPSKAPEAKVYAQGTDEFRYWNTASALSRGSEFWSNNLPDISWQVGNTLPVNLDAGIDLNAFYDRVGLSFFHKEVKNRTLFSCESADVVCHEQGHAILDAIKPQLWDAASIEVAAFHESFGDMSAILIGLQLPSVRLAVLTETQNSIYASSSLSRMAEQLGWGIRQKKPSAVDIDCLRNAVNSLFYQDPNTLPSQAPATSLSSDPHSLSRVFTAAFFEGLAGMFKLQAEKGESDLLVTSQDLAKILIEGVKVAAVVPTFFSQVAINMIQIAGIKFPNINYRQALKSAFVRHGVISPATPAAFAFNTTADRDFEEISSVVSNKELPKLRLSVSEYDLGVDTIVVHSASEPKRFDVTGAALSSGSVLSPSQDQAAKSFLEELLRSGHIKVVSDKNKNVETKNFNITRPNEPETHDSHTHELRMEGKDYVLRRIRIACKFC